MNKNEFSNEEISLKRLKLHFPRITISLLFFAIAVNGQSREVVILGSGDTMMGSWAEEIISDSGYAYPFQRLQNEISGADIFFTNLEAPFGTTGAAFDKRFTFRVKPALVNVLLQGGVNLVSLANNHTMDYGADCLRETIEVLKKNNIKYAGAGFNLKEARKSTIIEVKGKRIGFFSYSLTFPEEFWATDTSAGACFPYESFVFADVEALKQTVDFVIVACHWGAELKEQPKPYQIKFGHRLIDSGADLILGHHPHIVQGIENYKGKYIVYSLGNFIFGSYSESARDSFLFRLTLREPGETIAQLIPINVYNKEVDFRPEPLKDARYKAFLEKMNRLSSELNTDSIGISSKGLLSITKS